MARETGIEWTDATWNPIRGCSRVSEGCRHCYAEVVANRFCGPGAPYEGVVRIGADGKGTGQWNGEIKFVEERLLDPLRWKLPKRIFVNSMSDLFHEKVTDAMLDRIFAVMALCPQHTFQVLTKRPERMLKYLSNTRTSERTTRASVFIIPNAQLTAKGIEPDLQQEAMAGWANWPLPNVWLGVSVENQKAADERIPLLLQTPAAVRFLSVEPLLGSVRLRGTHNDEFDLDYASGELINVEPCETSYRLPYCDGLDWVICGGESGPGARPMHPDWARSLRDQCAAAGVPFFFKQWGEWVPFEPDGGPSEWKSQAGALIDRHAIPDMTEGTISNWSDACLYEGDDIVVHQRIGKKAAGHLLDGVEHHAFPEVRA